MYSIKTDKFELKYNPESLTLSVKTASREWCWDSDSGKIEMADKSFVYFKDAKKCTHKHYKTGVAEGVKAQYSGFENSDMEITTFVYADFSRDTVNFEFYITGNKKCEFSEVMWPCAFRYGADEGYTVITKMMGAAIPAKWDGECETYHWKKKPFTFTRDAYMPFMGQVDGKSGYLLIIDTPYNATCNTVHVPKGETSVFAGFLPSLGDIAPTDKRRVICHFYDECDYNTFAKTYRNYVKEKGRLITLKQKIAANPNVEYLVGAPVFHAASAINISPDSPRFDLEKPEENASYTTFAQTEKYLETLKSKGLDKVYLHLDGWGRLGYDRMHPDVFPPSEECGGTEGMKKLSEKCRQLGYKFGIHDQYRDYYFDADTFDLENAFIDANGNPVIGSEWFGGKQTLMCGTLYPEYLRRNYNEFERLGIQIDGSYLDVFSISELDECFNPDHMETKEENMRHRGECFDILNSRGIITSSEEAADSMIPYISLCHWAPLATDKIGSRATAPIGNPIPLLYLVYHDCIVVPWMGIKQKGGWCIPACDRPFLYALITGGTAYVSPWESDEAIEEAKVLLELHKKTALCELTHHEFVDGNPRVQKSTFSDGTTVEVDFDKDSYKITYPEEN